MIPRSQEIPVQIIISEPDPKIQFKVNPNYESLIQNQPENQEEGKLTPFYIYNRKKNSLKLFFHNLMQIGKNSSLIVSLISVVEKWKIKTKLNSYIFI